MLKITDLTSSKEMDSKTMTGVRGGSGFASFGALLDFSTAISSQVANVNQGFGFTFAQSNSGTVTNNQAISGGNGVIFAPVNQTQTQGNTMSISDIGNTNVGAGIPSFITF